MLRFLTAGESHGAALTAILEGIPAGLRLPADAIDRDLARRQVGYGRGGRMAIERDRVRLTAGVRHGYTLGSPIALLIENRDWMNWRDEMSPDEPGAHWQSQQSFRVPRPGHADLAGAAKYRHTDLRNVLERASARETAARVAVGAVCRRLLEEVGIAVGSVVLRIGPAAWTSPNRPSPELLAKADQSDVRCPDPSVADAMRCAIDAARNDGDSLGGVIEVWALGVPPGLGSYVDCDRRLDGRLAAALMAIPGIKGVEIGLGFAAAERRGSEVHDPIVPADGVWPFQRPTNNAGGLEGGITNGEPLVLRAAMKPIPTLTRPLPSVTLDGLKPMPAHAERSDVCAVPAAAVVAEAAVCFVLAQALLEKLGGDHVADVIHALSAYQREIASIWRRSGGD